MESKYNKQELQALIAEKYTINDMAKKYNVSYDTIRKVLKRKNIKPYILDMNTYEDNMRNMSDQEKIDYLLGCLERLQNFYSNDDIFLSEELTNAKKILTSGEFCIFNILYERLGKIVSHEAIFNAYMQTKDINNDVYPEIVKVFISRMRQKLDKYKIINVHSIGYVMERINDKTV